MRRIALTGAVVLLAAAGMTTSGSAAATTDPTIFGPKIVPYYAEVTLHGRTPDPFQKVTIFFRAAGDSDFTRRRDLRSDVDGMYSTSYHAARPQDYYARAAGEKSAIHRTRLVTADCIVSKPAFRHFPLYLQPSSPPWRPSQRFVSFTAVRGHRWVGYAYRANPMMFAAITWRPGQRAPHVLNGRVRIGFGYSGPEGHGSLSIAGITPHGAIVAAVQHTGPHGKGVWRFGGYYWTRGRRHALAVRPHWVDVRPKAVTGDGEIVAEVRARVDGHNRFLLVMWAGPRAQPVVLEKVRGHYISSLPVDAAGDIAYDRPDATVVRLASGEIRTLVDSSGAGVQPQFGAGPYLYGQSNQGLVCGT